MSTSKPPRVHPTAEVHPDAKIGEGSSIWNWAQVRENVTIGADCIISKGVYVDAGVEIGRACKVQNNVSLFNGVCRLGRFKNTCLFRGGNWCELYNPLWDYAWRMEYGCSRFCRNPRRLS